MIGRGKIRNLLEEMGRLGIHRDDLEELFVRGSGAGGQKINKTSSTVVLRHIPTGLEVRCQQERSLSQNRVLARAELCEKLRARLAARKQASAAALSKKRAQTRKRTRSEKALMIKTKRHRGETKSMRRKPRSDD